jgi:hypothetical protein
VATACLTRVIVCAAVLGVEVSSAGVVTCVTAGLAFGAAGSTLRVTGAPRCRATLVRASGAFTTLCGIARDGEPGVLGGLLGVLGASAGGVAAWLELVASTVTGAAAWAAARTGGPAICIT